MEEPKYHQGMLWANYDPRLEASGETELREGLATLYSRFLRSARTPDLCLSYTPTTPNFLRTSCPPPPPALQHRQQPLPGSPELTLGPELRPCLPTLPFPQESGHRGWQVDAQRPGRLGQGCPQDPGSGSPSCPELVPCSQDWAQLTRPHSPGAIAQVWPLPSTPWRHSGRHPERPLRGRS